MNLQRLLVERMENRILLGTVMFLGIMVLVGWVAINEQGRMQAFQSQHLARSVESGAELFAANCTSCHGSQGQGQAGIAPALNNPALFGHDFFAEINSEVQTLNSLLIEIPQLEADLVSDTRTLAEKEQIEARLTALREQYGEAPVEAIDARLIEMETQRVALNTQMQAAIDRGYDPGAPDRLAALGWAGTRDAFIHTTLISGRPVSESYWPQPMAAWSQTAGGPLREDQLQNLTNYILNWDRDWTLEDLLAVQQFAIRPGVGGGTSAVEEPVAPDIDTMTPEEALPEVIAITEEVMALEADPVNGQSLYNSGVLACSGCHINAVVAPLTQETWPVLISSERLSDPALADFTPEEYLVHSILRPHDYLVPGYGPVMPTYFGERLDAQGLADIIAYLKTYE